MVNIKGRLVGCPVNCSNWKRYKVARNLSFWDYCPEMFRFVFPFDEYHSFDGIYVFYSLAFTIKRADKAFTPSALFVRIT